MSIIFNVMAVIGGILLFGIVFTPVIDDMLDNLNNGYNYWSFPSVFVLLNVAVFIVLMFLRR